MCASEWEREMFFCVNFCLVTIPNLEPSEVAVEVEMTWWGQFRPKLKGKIMALLLIITAIPLLLSCLPLPLPIPLSLSLFLSPLPVPLSLPLSSSQFQFLSLSLTFSLTLSHKVISFFCLSLSLPQTLSDQKVTAIAEGKERPAKHLNCFCVVQHQN